MPQSTLPPTGKTPFAPNLINGVTTSQSLTRFTTIIPLPNWGSTLELVVPVQAELIRFSLPRMLPGELEPTRPFLLFLITTWSLSNSRITPSTRTLRLLQGINIELSLTWLLLLLIRLLGSVVGKLALAREGAGSIPADRNFSQKFYFGESK